MKSIWPERIRSAPTRMVVATPRRMMTLAALTKMPVPSSPWMVTFSWSSIFWFSPARYRASWLVARISRTFSRASWMPSETRTAAFFVRSELRAESLRVPNSRPKATGTPHRQAMASCQSYTSRHTAMSAVER